MNWPFYDYLDATDVEFRVAGCHPTLDKMDVEAVVKTGSHSEFSYFLMPKYAILTHHEHPFPSNRIASL